MLTFPLSHLLTKAARLVMPLVLFAFFLPASLGRADIRFPPPDFESGYKMLTTQNPIPRSVWLESFDVVVLAVTLGLATWLVFRKRSRKGVVWLSLFSLLYFGFYREGCICAIGSIQNVALGLFNNGYAVPLTAAGFFALPLVAALFFGRTFCAAVCPHGALQDLLLIKPLNIPRWAERGLGSIPFVYLGLAVLFAATGSTFIICRIDPFIPIFRISGSLASLLLSAAFLVAALFIGRPYCRFLCPYGALLKLAAGVARWRVRVTPDFCTQCKLCAESCPFGVIAEPSTAVVTPKSLPVERRRFLALLALLPVLVVVGGFTGVRFGEVAARVNPNVRLAAQFIANQNGADLQFSDKADELAFIRAQHSAAALLPVAEAALQRFRVGGAIFGAWVGLVIGARLLAFAAGRKRTDYEPERTGCFACARCFSFCPQERVRLGLPVDSPVSAKAA